MASRLDLDLQRQIGGRLRTLRHRRGLTLEQVAIRIDTPTSVLGRIEGGDRGVSLPTLFQLARALGYPPAELVTLDDDSGLDSAVVRAPDEEDLVALWRVAPDEIREALLRLLRAAVRG